MGGKECGVGSPLSDVPVTFPVMSGTPPCALLRSLVAATEAHPLDRKLLVCRTVGEGRELLRAAAVRGHSWLGWEVTTPRRLALELVGPALAEAGLEVADGFDEESALDVALDVALEREAVRPLRELGDTPGFREAVANAVGALRLAGVEPARLRAVPAPNGAVRELLATVLEVRARQLAARARVDTAHILEEAARRLPAIGLSADLRVFLLPGLNLRGVSGDLVRAARATGAVVLAADPVAGPIPEGVLWCASAEPSPLGGVLAEPSDGTRPVVGVELDLFVASGPAEELREVLRRVMESGLRWDEVEIVATDPVVYGSALHGLAERLEIPVSFGVGLPVERTRTGRVVAAYFQWIQSGYPAAVLRRLLESDDLRPPAEGVGGVALARRLRALRVGWGHDRYLPALERALESLYPVRCRGQESDAEAADRVAREREALRSLRSILEPLLRATPRLDARDAASTVSPARLAEGLRALLGLARPGDAPSLTARDRMLAIADRVAATLTRPAPPAAAIATLQRHLRIRVPAPRREGSAPWLSSGGHLHLTDFDHGGITGRRATFVVGLDAERAGGAALQDPLLLDGQRRALAPDALPTSADRLEADRFRTGALLSRLRGRVTLSYSAWDPVEARQVAPSPVLLQAHRARTGDAAASFEDLREALGEAASPVPRTGVLDLDDLWLDLLDRGGVLAAGAPLVRSLYPSLDRGVAAAEARSGDEASAHHGLIRARPDRLDPRRSSDVVLSASGLEDLGTCGLRWLYRYGLGIRPPDEPEPDPDAWLNALDRGRLLHEVYESTLREARDAGVSAADPDFVRLALDILEREADRMLREVPSPGAAVRQRELTELREDVRSFARMMEGEDGRWAELELKFGLAGRDPAPIDVAGGTIRLRGAIDRVDRVGDAHVVVDYKTGSSDRFERRHGTFHGGRRLQNVIYAAVAESLLGRPVDRMEYHFPTRRGQNERIGYRRDELRKGLGLVSRLLDMVAEGRLLPTERGDDCRFCHFAPVCRHRSDGWASETPMADWADARLADLPEYRHLREVRRWEELFLAELESDG